MVENSARPETSSGSEIEKRSISDPSFSVEEKADRPNLALLQRLLDANLLA